MMQVLQSTCGGAATLPRVVIDVLNSQACHGRGKQLHSTHTWILAGLSKQLTTFFYSPWRIIKGLFELIMYKYSNRRGVNKQDV